MKTVEDYIRTIPNFPEEGIMFRDITSVLQDPDGLHLAIDEMQKKLEETVMWMSLRGRNREDLFSECRLPTIFTNRLC